MNFDLVLEKPLNIDVLLCNKNDIKKYVVNLKNSAY